MSDLKFSCPHCNQHLELPEDMCGTVVDCPSCGNRIQTPTFAQLREGGPASTYTIIGVDGSRYGPVTADQLRQWIREGRVNAATRVQVEGNSDWKALGEIAEFAALSSVKAPPPYIGSVTAGTGADVASDQRPLPKPMRYSPPESSALQGNLNGAETGLSAHGISRTPMFLFTYMALTKSKEKKTGSVTAPNRVEAIRALEKHGLLPIRISEPEAVPIPVVAPAATPNMGASPAGGHSGSVETGERFCPVAVVPPLREPLMITLAESVPADAPGERFEVVRQNGETVTIASAERLREYILKSYFARNTQVRKVLVDEAGTRTESAWTALEQLGDCRPSIDVLYRPIWHRTMKWLWYGVIGGVILKALDTAVFMFEANESVGVLWVAMILGLGLSVKWHWVKWVAFIIIGGVLKEGKLNVGVLLPMFGGALFTTVLIGALFGALVGMIIGTIIGYCRASSGPRAPDALPEGNKPLTLGLYAPIGGLVVLIPIYIWLINKIANAYGN